MYHRQVRRERGDGTVEPDQPDSFKPGPWRRGGHHAHRDPPYHQPVYDYPQFIVGTTWRLCGGWCHGDPDQFLPASTAQQEREWVSMAGGVSTVLDRVRALSANGKLPLAFHLIETAFYAHLDSAEVHQLRADVYEARATGDGRRWPPTCSTTKPLPLEKG